MVFPTKIHDATEETVLLPEVDHPVGSEVQFVRESALRAGRQLEEGNVQGAEATLRQALDAMPGDPRCRSYLAICLASGRRKLVTAEKIARSVLLQYPEEPTAYFALGRIHILAGRRRQGFRCYAKAGALATGDRALLAALAGQDPRRSSVIPSLARDHVLNIILGRLRRILTPSRRR